MREIKFSYMWHDGKAWMDLRYTLEEIENGEHWKSLDSIPVLNKFKLKHRRQYTERNDVNGVEIYDGDLITANDYPFYSDGMENKEEPSELNYIGVVGIDSDGWYYDLKPVSNRVSGRACGSNLDSVSDSCKVIGNIYEHPHLLEQGS